MTGRASIIVVAELVEALVAQHVEIKGMLTRAPRNGPDARPVAVASRASSSTSRMRWPSTMPV